ncbi:transposase [Fusobacterium varium]|nr:transposase [Fusobacterium varium]
MLEAEMTQHLGYDPYEHSESTNARNVRKRKIILSKYGDTEIKVPQDKEGTFEPQIINKRQKDISDIEDKIISMYVIGKGIMMLFMEQKLFL